MPSRASYSYVLNSVAGDTADLIEMDMDVEDADDQDNIILAAQLSRVVCRKLEIAAYGHLQRALNDWSSLASDDMLKFVREMGCVLLTLRWRVSWWELLGNGGDIPDPSGREAFAYRVNRLCRVLYFYFCMIRRKLPPFLLSKELYGVWSTYPDTSIPIFEDFPQEESLDRFPKWMLNGKRLIITSGVEGRLAGIGLRHERLSESDVTIK